MLKIAVVYATSGRADLVCRTVEHLGEQSRQPDLVIVSAVKKADVVGVDQSWMRPEIILGPIGLCRQRNAGMTAAGSRSDVIVFFDDDFLPASNYLEEVEALFDAEPTLVGATGRIIADGIKTPGYSFADGLQMLAEDQPPQKKRSSKAEALYGCNMIFRAAAAAKLKFDEQLPFYGWLEDIDFTYRLGRCGSMVMSERLAGVHLGFKGGRTSGLRFGYSQIANPIYLLRKGSAPPGLAYRMMLRNLIANLVRSFRPEPYVDRIGRLKGNLLALNDFFQGRIDPMRIVSLK